MSAVPIDLQRPDWLAALFDETQASRDSAAICARLERYHARDGIEVQRTIDVREQVAAGSLVTHRRRDTGAVNDQQQQAAHAVKEALAHRRDLFRPRAVDEPFGSQRVAAVRACCLRSRPLRAPLVIVVGVDPPNEPRVSEIENICAAAAAVQNLLLAAQALGLGSLLSTLPVFASARRTPPAAVN